MRNLPLMRFRARRALLLLAVALPLLGADRSDPGLLLKLDRQAYRLTSYDLRDGARGPSLRVSLGSPAYATPAGRYAIREVIRNPGWKPGPDALALGARAVAPSPDGPLGIAKLPFGAGGYALHGGAHPLLLGKPVSLGCVRALDEDLLGLLAWLDSRQALGEEEPQPDGERSRRLARRLRLVIR